MGTDALTDAVAAAMEAIGASLPSQALALAVTGSRPADGGGARPVRGSVSACILSSGFADPLGALATGTDAKAVTLLVPKSGDGAWFDRSDPIPGDVLETAEGVRYSVVSVEAVRGVYYKVGARQC